MRNSKSINIRECANCGAPIQSTSLSEIIVCEYCGSVFSKKHFDEVLCPKCKSRDQTEKVSLIFNRSPVTTNYQKYFLPPQKPIEPYKFKEIRTKFPIKSGSILAISLLMICRYSEKPGSDLFAFYIVFVAIMLIVNLFVFKSFISDLNENMSINNHNEKNQKSYNEKLTKYYTDLSTFPKKRAVWEKLFFCYRDEIVFLPNLGTFIKFEEIDSYIHSSYSDPDVKNT
jgi:hypothetical protein